jgi:uncharacterized ParB-like nuclease family protein/RNA-binding protein YhbY
MTTKAKVDRGRMNGAAKPPRRILKLASRGLRLEISKITVDKRVNQRVDAINDETVARHAEAMAAGEKFPPITVFKPDDGPSEYILADGFHRIAAAQQIGHECIRCDVYPGSLKDAAFFACGSNCRHGLPRTSADKRRAIATLLRLSPQSSDREVAKAAGTTHRTGAKVRRELIGKIEPDLDVPEVVKITTLEHAEEAESPLAQRIRSEIESRSCVVAVETCGGLGEEKLKQLGSNPAAERDMWEAVFQRAMHEVLTDAEIFLKGRFFFELENPAMLPLDAWDNWFYSLPRERQTFLRELKAILEESTPTFIEGEPSCPTYQTTTLKT